VVSTGMRTGDIGTELFNFMDKAIADEEVQRAINYGRLLAQAFSRSRR
jgi:hypothetical protein